MRSTFEARLGRGGNDGGGAPAEKPDATLGAPPSVPEAPAARRGEYRTAPSPSAHALPAEGAPKIAGENGVPEPAAISGTAADRQNGGHAQHPRARDSALKPISDPNVHVASMGGRQVVALRKRDRERDTIVECIVLPSGALRVAPTSVGPFEFPGSEQAEAFVDEVLASLSVLGCHVTRGAERPSAPTPDDQG